MIFFKKNRFPNFHRIVIYRSIIKQFIVIKCYYKEIPRACNKEFQVGKLRLVVSPVVWKSYLTGKVVLGSHGGNELKRLEYGQLLLRGRAGSCGKTEGEISVLKEFWWNECKGYSALCRVKGKMKESRQAKAKADCFLLPVLNDRSRQSYQQVKLRGGNCQLIDVTHLSTCLISKKIILCGCPSSPS